MTRSEHRRYAFALVYRIPFAPVFDIDAAYRGLLEYIKEEIPGAAPVSDYIKKPADGVCRYLSQIDAEIKKRLINWELDRIASVDLAILRLAVYEILYEPDIPRAVSINEAVELAKAYGTDDSASFINGTLAKIVQDTAE